MNADEREALARVLHEGQIACLHIGRGEWETRWCQQWADVLTTAVDQIAEARVRAALNEVGTAIGSLLQSNPINGDCSNYTLRRLLNMLDEKAENHGPSLAANVEHKRRDDELEQRMREFNNERPPP